jgi:transposase-like protein
MHTTHRAARLLSTVPHRKPNYTSEHNRKQSPEQRAEALEQVRVPRLRGREEVGLLEKYQRHALDEVLFALAVGGPSQRKVVSWARRFLGGTLSPTTIGAVLRPAR